jgi:hypothetical protein
LDTLPIPPFPERKTGIDFQHWPRQQPDEETGLCESDLLDWIVGSLETLSPTIYQMPGRAEKRVEKRLMRQMKEMHADRKAGEFLFGKPDKNGKFFCIVKVGSEEVFCHESNFIEAINRGVLIPGKTMYLNVDRTRDKPFGKFVSYTSKYPEESLRKTIRDRMYPYRYDPQRAEKAVFAARFPSYAVWQYGHTVTESECPAEFRKAICAGIKDAEQIIADANTEKSLRDELFFFLCRLHEDSPVSVHRELTRIVQSGLISDDTEKPIAYAIGNSSQEWQKQLLEAILLSESKSKIKILAIVLWRSRYPIASLEPRHMLSLLPQLLQQMEEQSKSLKSPKSIQRIITRLELLLALLRTRESPDIEMKKLLSPDSEHGKRFINLIDEITKHFVEKGKPLSTRVELQLEKPPEYEKVPDLLYAIRLYLTGDDRANAIRVTGVSDED